jgi:hypothetical protein
MNNECATCGGSGKESRRDVAERLSSTLRCNCDLDNWEPERSTGHSWVCSIHKAAMDSTIKLGVCPDCNGVAQ